VLRHVPEVGFFDIKEQLLPRLHALGEASRATRITRRVRRIRDRAGYLDAVRSWALARPPTPEPATPRRAGSAHGACVISQGAAVGAGAVLHDSVLLAGAHVGARAIVSRSVIGRGGRVAAGGRALKAVLP
jgi:NDP-sugar pyrophosphorylase family protein